MFNLYQDHSYDPTNNAERNLIGRTHYVDPDTRRYFKSRILSTTIAADGLLFALVESCSGDYDHKTRIFRPVVFDVFGDVIHRPDKDASFKSSKQARKALRDVLSGIDALVVTELAIQRQEANYTREIAAARETLAQLREETQAA